MRRVCLVGLIAVLSIIAVVPIHDHRPLGAQVHARAAGQRRSEAVVAWVEGPTRLADHGHLVVASTLVSGQLQRFASHPLPADPSDCRLWLEENSEAIQAVARCPGYATVRLTADNRTLPAIGPLDRPGILYDLYPLTAFDSSTIVQHVRPHEPQSSHPILWLLAVCAAAPLLWPAVRKKRIAIS